MVDKKSTSNGEKLLYCSFCGKSQHEVKKLIAGPSVFICDECIDLCNEIIRDEAAAAEDESGSVSLKCKGLDGYPVYVKEGDLRQSAFFGPIDDLYVERAFESFGTFNHAGEKVEWRVDAGGKPVAAILRYVIEHADPKTGAPSKSSQGQILVVSKVAQKDNGQGCVAGYVDALANPDANDLARQIGDTVVPDFRCGGDEPTWHGKKGERADEPMRYLPQ